MATCFPSQFRQRHVFHREGIDFAPKNPHTSANRRPHEIYVADEIKQ